MGRQDKERFEEREEEYDNHNDWKRTPELPGLTRDEQKRK